MSVTLREVFVVSVYDKQVSGESIICMDMRIIAQIYTIPVIVYGTLSGEVSSLYGFENMTCDSSIRKTTWTTKYSAKHSSKVLSVGIIESRANAFVVSASSDELLVHYLLDPETIICKYTPSSGSKITAMRTTQDNQIFVALSDGGVEVMCLELRAPRNTMYRMNVKHSIKASRFKSLSRVASIVRLDIVYSVEPFDVMCPLDESQKVAALSSKSLVVLSSPDANIYYEKTVANCGILAVARQTHADHAWLMRDGTINVLFSKKTSTMTELADKGVCDLAMLNNQTMIAVGSRGEFYFVDGKQVLYADKILGCDKAFCAREIGNVLYVLQFGTPEILRINTDVMRESCAFIFPILKDNKTFKIPQTPLLPHLFPPRKHVNLVLQRLAKWCAAPIEIPARQMRQTINECYYLSLAIPDYVPGSICKIFEMSIGGTDLSDQAIYVMLKCIQVVMKMCAKTKIARVLSLCYLTNWNHRYFVLHLLAKDPEIAALAKTWISDAIFSMPPSSELCELVEAAEANL